MLADIEGPGAIQHIWLTVHPLHWRRIAFRIYWDGEETPSVEVPIDPGNGAKKLGQPVPLSNLRSETNNG